MAQQAHLHQQTRRRQRRIAPQPPQELEHAALIRRETAVQRAEQERIHRPVGDHQRQEHAFRCHQAQQANHQHRQTCHTQRRHESQRHLPVIPQEADVVHQHPAQAQRLKEQHQVDRVGQGQAGNGHHAAEDEAARRQGQQATACQGGHHGFIPALKEHIRHIPRHDLRQDGGRKHGDKHRIGDVGHEQVAHRLGDAAGAGRDLYDREQHDADQHTAEASEGCTEIAARPLQPRGAAHGLTQLKSDSRHRSSPPRTNGDNPPASAEVDNAFPRVDGR